MLHHLSQSIADLLWNTTKRFIVSSKQKTSERRSMPLRWIMLTFKNIGKFIRFHPIMFLFLIFAQIVCCVAVFISCGMAYNMEYVEKPPLETQYFCYVFQMPQSLTLSNEYDNNGNLIKTQYYLDDKKSIDSVEYPDAIPFGEYKSLMDKAFIAANNSHLFTTDILLYRGNYFDVSEDFTLSYHTIYPEAKGNFLGFNEEQIETDEKIFFAHTTASNGKHSDYCYYYTGKKYNLNGTEFKCVGESSYTFIPYNSIPDNFAVGQIWFYYDGTLTEDQINDIKEKLDNIFGSRSVETAIPEAYDPIEIQYSRMLFVVSIIVMIIIILALAKFYRFVLSSRKTTLAVLRLCGCTKTKAHILYMLEISFTISVTTALGYIIYKYIFHTPIAEMYPAFESFYITPVYLAVICTYIITAIIVMIIAIIPEIRKKIL